MKVLIPVLNFGRAGGSRVLSRLADELIILGYEVNFLCPDKSDLPYFPTLAQIIWVNIQGDAVENEYTSAISDSGWSIQKKLYRGLKKQQAYKYDVIFANHSLTVLPIRRANLLHKTIYYVQAYEPEYYQAFGGFKNKIWEFLSKQSYNLNLFTIVNAGIYLDYKNLKSSRVLYPGIDFTRFFPHVKTLPSEKIIIGTIGRKEVFKGTQYVIRAFNELKKRFPTLELHIAFGDSNDYKDSKDIFCCHPDGDSELGNYYRSLDYYICGGNIQMGAFHYPVVEAMSCGTPVITTNYYPVDENNAWEIPLHNFSEIIAQFELAEKDPTLKERKVSQGLNDVRQFEWKSVGKKLDIYIKEFLAGSQ